MAQAVPFVNDNHQRATAVEDKAQQREILIGNPLPRINHQQHHVGVFDRLQGFNHREFLDDIGDLTAFAHAGGVNQHIFTLVALHRDVDAVAGRSGHVVDHYAVFAQDTVGER